MAASGTRISSFMGHKQIKATMSSSASRQALNQQFQASMRDVLGNLKAFIDELDAVSPAILVEALEPTLGKAIEYCPIDTGDLRKSAYLEARRFRGRSEVEIGFGRGGHPHYAVFVHEMPIPRQPPTRSQFLRAAVDEDYYTILNSIPRMIREWAGT